MAIDDIARSDTSPTLGVHHQEGTPGTTIEQSAVLRNAVEIEPCFASRVHAAEFSGGHAPEGVTHDAEPAGVDAAGK